MGGAVVAGDGVGGGLVESPHQGIGGIGADPRWGLLEDCTLFPPKVVTLRKLPLLEEEGENLDWLFGPFDDP